MGVSTEQWRLTIGCYHPHPHNNKVKHPHIHVNPQTRRTFVRTLINVSLCLLAVSVVFFIVFGTTSLASIGLHTKVRILSTHIQTLHKPSLLVCMDIHPDPGSITVNNLPSPIRKLYNQVRRINSRIVRSKHRLRTFKGHLHSGTLPKGYSPNINPAIGSVSNKFLNNWQKNLPKYGKEQLKLSIQDATKLIDSLSKQSNSLLEKLKLCCSMEDYNLLTNKLISLDTKLDNQLNLSSFQKSSNNRPPKAMTLHLNYTIYLTNKNASRKKT